MQERRVAITGLGWATGLGLEVEPAWQKLLDGVSGISMVERWDASEHAVRIGGEVKDFEGGPHVEVRTAKKMDRFAQFAMHASIEAVNDSGLDFSKEDPWMCGSIIGSGVGGIQEFADGHARLVAKGPNRLSPFMVPKLMCNAACGNVSIHYGLQGPNFATTTACASAGHAIGAGADSIRLNQADVIIAGGSEAALTALGLGCFIGLKALSKRNDAPTLASRPFDEDRDGFVLSEGAGIVILEELEHAKARGATLYAEVLGWGQSADGSHITAPLEDGAGAAHAMTLALKHSGVNPEQVDYINAHGTSTGLGDLAETKAVKRVFGEDTAVPVSSTKSMTGHLLGASGGVEAIACAKALHTGIAPPTINLENPGEGCTLDYIPNTARQVDPKIALSNSFGFGGHNVSLVLGKL
ncbi:MAG: beta-ketoacyl-ACP synthase II [Planctomycetota bacterium]